MSMDNKYVLHVDGSFCEYINDKNDIVYVAGFGAYMVNGGKIRDKFSNYSFDIPFIFRHEEHAILESLKWLLSKQIKSDILVKTDSLSAINLFSGQKKPINQDDRFLLMNFLLIENLFDSIELEYKSRELDDLSHNLSRNYIKEIPSNFKQVKNNAYVNNKPIVKDKDLIFQSLVNVVNIYRLNK